MRANSIAYAIFLASAVRAQARNYLVDLTPLPGMSLVTRGYGMVSAVTKRGLTFLQAA